MARLGVSRIAIKGTVLALICISAVALLNGLTVRALAAPSKLSIQGAGYGHGLGMSQWGAFGMARAGHDYQSILKHYFVGTDITPMKLTQNIRVRLRQSAAPITFSGATEANNGVQLDPTRTYTVRRTGLIGVALYSGTRKELAVPSLTVSNKGQPIRLGGRAENGITNGTYRGSLEFFSAGLTRGTMVVNTVPLESYVASVIPKEISPSWPMESLKAQAVAARSYVIAGGKRPGTFDVFADTRSQMYGGAGVEAKNTTAATSATAGQIVTYKAKPVATYFFSSSGGQTENAENVWGSVPKPWLKSVADPHDRHAPRHRWGIDMSFRQAQSKLRGLVKGSFKGINVTKRGASPRIVSAEIIGSRGRTQISGPMLRTRLGLYSAWADIQVVR